MPQRDSTVEVAVVDSPKALPEENRRLMTRSPLSLTAGAFIAAAALFIPAIIQAQIPGGSSARDIQTEVQKTDPRVDQVLERANDHFRKGKLNLEDNKREQARDEFDKAIDEILMSGLDVRASQKLQTGYLELVEKIYREEVPLIQASPQQNATPVVAQGTPNPKVETVEVARVQPPKQVLIGFRQQGFDPSPLDPLSKLILNPTEQKVSGEQLDALEQAKNSLDFNFTINPLIQQFINYYQGRGRSTMESGLRRSGRYMALARRIFKEEGVPIDIAWLSQVESAWKPTAVSHAAASGLWQFVPATGRQYGLRQSAWIDKRYNGNWELAMGGYNTGAGNIDRGIARAGTANFWSIYPYLYQETRNYVPNILATILIAKNPEKYGFAGIRPEAPLSYDVVQLPTATSLQLLADATDSSVDFLRSINPELRRDVTPREGSYNVRVPAGRSKQMVALLKRIPSDRRDTARVISIAPGEDLQSVANRTGVSVAQLQAFNNGVDLKSTTKLVVPTGGIKLASWRRAKPTTEDTAVASLTKVRARKGDTIAKIAAAHHVEATEVARLNGLSVNGPLTAGQEIRLPAAASGAPAPKSRRR